MFSIFKKKPCCCGETAKAEPCCGEITGAVKSIKVLGAGCAACHKQFENVKEAVQALGLATEVEYITDLSKVAEYGVMSMPAIVVNEKVISMGKVVSAADFKKILDKFI